MALFNKPKKEIADKISEVKEKIGKFSKLFNHIKDSDIVINEVTKPYNINLDDLVKWLQKLDSYSVNMDKNGLYIFGHLYNPNKRLLHQSDELLSALESLISEKRTDNPRIIFDGVNKPVRCSCGSINFDKQDIEMLEGHMCEYNLVCDDCGLYLGSYSYGNWKYR